MTRLFVVYRTFDRIWTCKTYTRELAPFEMDMSNGPVKLMFLVDQMVKSPSGEEMLVLNSHFFRRHSISGEDTISFYCTAHDTFYPKIIKPCPVKPVPLSPTQGAVKGLMRRYSVPSLECDLHTFSEISECQDVIYFVLPMYRCTVLLDAHVACSVNFAFSRSRVFRRRFWNYLLRKGGFRNCIPDYEEWTQEERDAWENYLPVPYMIDLVAVWPKQKIDYAWSYRILGLLNKRVVLEEGFAWLSTLGGAHSSLGEIFSYHAERAGEISAKQLRLAIELGNESLIARCYVFWAWSLLQRGRLRKCKTCVLNTWKFCRRLQAHDHILENMCRAVWSRLKYKQALLKAKHRHCVGGRSRQVDRGDGSGSDDDFGCKVTGPSMKSQDFNNMSDMNSTTNTANSPQVHVDVEVVMKPPSLVVNTVQVC